MFPDVTFFLFFCNVTIIVIIVRGQYLRKDDLIQNNLGLAFNQRKWETKDEKDRK